jgi:hypothetical protein
MDSAIADVTHHGSAARFARLRRQLSRGSAAARGARRSLTAGLRRWLH